MNKKFILLSVLGLLIVSSFFSCKKENTLETAEKLDIVIKEVGIDNNMKVYAGQDLHIDADVTATRKISSIKIQITLAETNYGWDFTKTYTTGYVNLKNANFHEHIDVPDNAKAGKYELLIIVTDELGEKVQQKVEFEIVKDPTLPVLKGISLKVVSPSMLNISGLVNAPNKIKELSVEVQSADWTKVFKFLEEDMVNQTSYNLNKNIDINGAPAGHYHINVKLTDQADKTMLYQIHLDR